MKYLFKSDFFQKVGRIADFFLVSLLWLITSLPIITIMTSTIAMYYAVVKSVRYNAGTSTIKNYLHAFRINIKQGVALSILFDVIVVILYTFVDVAVGVGLATLYGKVYIVLTVIYVIIVGELVFWTVPIISRFSITIFSALKLAFRFLKKQFIQLIPYMIALIGIVILCYIVPPLILVLPAGFCYSLSNLVEPALLKYMEENTDEALEVPSWLTSNE